MASNGWAHTRAWKLHCMLQGQGPRATGFTKKTKEASSQMILKRAWKQMKAERMAKALIVFLLLPAIYSFSGGSQWHTWKLGRLRQNSIWSTRLIYSHHSLMRFSLPGQFWSSLVLAYTQLEHPANASPFVAALGHLWDVWRHSLPPKSRALCWFSICLSIAARSALNSSWIHLGCTCRKTHVHTIPQTSQQPYSLPKNLNSSTLIVPKT